MEEAWFAKHGSFAFLDFPQVQKGGDWMLELFDYLFLTIELISLALQVLEYKNNSRAENTVVIIGIQNPRLCRGSKL